MTIGDRISKAFGAVQGLRNGIYDSGAEVVQPGGGSRVVSIGNIAVGGRGKSPLAIHVASALARKGVKVALLLRGYLGGMEAKGGVVSTGDGPLVPWDECGDEAWQAALLCEGVTVRVGANRIAQARAAVAHGARVLVLDDGFQHRRLARDLDIVCVSPEDMDEGASFLPAGILRESPESLNRADIVAGYATDWEGVDGPPNVLFTLEPSFLLTRDGRLPLLGNLPKRAHVMCGIANPQRFSRTVEEAGIPVGSTSFFKDHHRFSTGELERCVAAATDSGCEAIITTIKDFARLPRDLGGFPILGLGVETRIVSGEGIWEKSMNSIC